MSLMEELSPSATKIRLAEIPPVACSSCCGQYPQRRHVDFSASHEGPMFEPLEGVAGGKPISAEDLIICDECLTAAAKLLGLGDVGEIQASFDRLRDDFHEQLTRANNLEDYSKTLETAVAQRKSLDKVNEPSQRVSKSRRR